MIPKPPGPEDDNYVVETQADGSLALHIKQPDGSVGPVVKVIPPIARPHHGKK
jgi:hypothetical protein